MPVLQHDKLTCDIIIADNHPFFIYELKKIFKPYKKMRIVATTTNTDEILDQLSSTPCDVLLVDDSFTRCEATDQSDSIEKMLTCAPHLKIVVLSAREDLSRIVHYLESGAAAFIRKNGVANNLMNLIQTISKAH